jgi:L,D-peptidoglycan transpeptidase YkuD (ErfK/YbiS/YcfS/YnhG family)
LRDRFHYSIEILMTFIYKLDHYPGGEGNSMKNDWILRFLLFLLVLISVSACVPRHRAPAADIPEMRVYPPDKPSQILLVSVDSFLFLTSVSVYALEKRDGDWRQALGPIKAVAGRNGFAPKGEKREGDGRTPTGLYRLGTAFGYPSSAGTKMPYRQAQADDLWVDDPASPDYNRWVKQSETRAASYEKMKRDDDLYKYGIVIEYNTDPIVPGFGSAIFLHIWAGKRSTTAGCIAVSEEDILKILGWLDPAAEPVIIIHPDPD